MEDGVSKAYALNNIQARGKLFIGAQEEIYAGMIIGENARRKISGESLQGEEPHQHAESGRWQRHQLERR
jgi:hypothetical protein